MLKRATIVMALAASALLGTLAAPAHAQSAQTSCSTNGRVLSATAYYTPEGQGRRWTRFTYEFDRAPVNKWGHKNNLDIKLVEAYKVIVWIGGRPIETTESHLRYHYESPDDRRMGTTYSVTPSTPIFTAPPGEAHVHFEGIFDRYLGSDPRCTAHTGPH